MAVVGAEVVAVDAVVVDVSKIAVRPPIQTPIKGHINSRLLALHKGSDISILVPHMGGRVVGRY